MSAIPQFVESPGAVESVPARRTARAVHLPPQRAQRTSSLQNWRADQEERRIVGGTGNETAGPQRATRTANVLPTAALALRSEGTAECGRARGTRARVGSGGAAPVERRHMCNAYITILTAMPGASAGLDCKQVSRINMGAKCTSLTRDDDISPTHDLVISWLAGPWLVNRCPSNSPPPRAPAREIRQRKPPSLSRRVTANHGSCLKTACGSDYAISSLVRPAVGIQLDWSAASNGPSEEASCPLYHLFFRDTNSPIIAPSAVATNILLSFGSAPVASQPTLKFRTTLTFADNAPTELQLPELHKLHVVNSDFLSIMSTPMLQDIVLEMITPNDHTKCFVPKLATSELSSQGAFDEERFLDMVQSRHLANSDSPPADCTYQRIQTIALRMTQKAALSAPIVQRLRALARPAGRTVLVDHAVFLLLRRLGGSTPGDGQYLSTR
ncbi:hypothetical protein C8R44DRAFT_735100 [Mycena epipterygia]|nr:hypothetical protein C8R44DRAFT_735100 [Mycena epipterygia]